MYQYRIYCLNEEGRFSRVAEIEATDDAEALLHAGALRHSGPCEIWERDRLVGRIEASTRV